MLVPVGKHRHQVNQGGCKNESLVESDAFKKLAADFSPITDPEAKNPAVPDDLQSAMNQGTSLREPAMEEPNDVPETPEPTPQPAGGGVTDQGQRVTQTVQQALGLDPSQGWKGSTTFESGLGGDLTGITIKLVKQEGQIVQKV